MALSGWGVESRSTGILMDLDGARDGHVGLDLGHIVFCYVNRCLVYIVVK